MHSIKEVLSISSSPIPVNAVSGSSAGWSTPVATAEDRRQKRKYRRAAKKITIFAHVKHQRIFGHAGAACVCPLFHKQTEALMPPGKLDEFRESGGGVHSVWTAQNTPWFWLRAKRDTDVTDLDGTLAQRCQYT